MFKGCKTARSGYQPPFTAPKALHQASGATILSLFGTKSPWLQGLVIQADTSAC